MKSRVKLQKSGKWMRHVNGNKHVSCHTLLQKTDEVLAFLNLTRLCHKRTPHIWSGLDLQLSKGTIIFPLTTTVFLASSRSTSKDRDALLPSAQQVCDVIERHAITLQIEQSSAAYQRCTHVSIMQRRTSNFMISQSSFRVSWPHVTGQWFHTQSCASDINLLTRTVRLCVCV